MKDLLFALVLLLMHVPHIVSQTLEPTTEVVTVAKKDPAALALLKKSLVLMGGSAWATVNDYTLVGVEHGTGAADDDKGSAIALLGTSKGSFRVEVTKDGLRVRAVTFDGQHGQRSLSSGTPTPLPPHAAFGMPPLFPLPTLAIAITAGNVAVIDRGSTQWDGVTARVFESRMIIPSHASFGSPLNRLTAKLYYLNPDSGQLMGISFRSYSVSNSSAFVESSVHYSDFRSEQGIDYPHTVTEYLNRQPIRRVTFTSLATNSGLDDSHFHL